MKSFSSLVAAFAALVCVSGAYAQKTSPVEARPLYEVVTTKTKPVKAGAWAVPVITWGGDVATIMAERAIFKEEGLDVKLVAENDFARQVQMALDGETVCLRGTMGMINSAAEAFEKAGQELVVVYQMTWSNGGDALVARDGKSLSDINVIGAQLYGPHMDYGANILAAANRLDSVRFVWYKELTLPTYDTKGAVIDPVSAFRSDKSLDAVLCIIPDALALTSNGTTGTGAEGSVKGARITLTSKSANRIIGDVYAFRRDFFDANRAKVQAFVHALLRGQEALAELRTNKAQRAAEYQQVLSRSADLLLGAPQATADVEALLGDCEFVGFAGNVAFFSEGEGRTFAKLTDEIQTSFIKMKLMNKTAKLGSANWDYKALAAGLKNADTSVVVTPKFDARKVQAAIEEQLMAEPESFSTDGTLFQIEITFEPNQATFSAEKYGADYSRAFGLAQTYGGAIVLIEGHADPTGIQKSKRAGASNAKLAEQEQGIKNLSYNRANAVRKAYLEFCKRKGVELDESQFIALGVGVKSPKFPEPKDAQEWAANRRVVFRIKQVEAEASEFVPVK
jgi:outer membrane protein OmpA-like peptidoglycan-associated protein/ABC-type nitrate/sulfonate/bicarbonate transport system substrate-binding protein